MKKLTILVDMDDVLINLLSAWVGALNEKYCTSVNYEDVSDWDLGRYFPMLLEEEIEAVLSVPSFWNHVNPKAGAVAYIEKLKSEGHSIFVVTSSHYTTIYPKMKSVLFRYFPSLTWDDVIVTSHKQMISGDVLIDDGAHNLIGGNYVKILMDMPHNHSFDTEKYGMVRAKDWKEVYDEVCKLSEDMQECGECTVCGGDDDVKIAQSPYVIPKVAASQPTKLADKQEIQPEPITLFTTDCPKCKVLKGKLDSKGISFVENKSKEAMEKLGIKQVPVLKVDAKMLSFVEANNWINQQKG